MLDKISEKFEEGVPIVSEAISDQVALKVVGESYYKWNSVSSFYPAVTVIFRQMHVATRLKRTQVKTRYNVRSEDFTEAMLAELHQRAEGLAGLRYNHGLTRGNYVSSDKRFKTTVYGQSTEDIAELFHKLLPVINEPFELANLSYTSGPRRVSITRRNVPLAGIPTQYNEYTIDFDSSSSCAKPYTSTPIPS